MNITVCISYKSKRKNINITLTILLTAWPNDALEQCQ